MKILAISDIHGAVGAARRLTEIDHGKLDVVVVAGDIGCHFTDVEHRRSALEVMSALDALDVPILYVYGNWDHDQPYRRNFGERCHHLHLRPCRVGDFTFVGFSGCPSHWGKNPIASKCDNRKDALRLNIEALAATIDDPERTVVVTHEKISHAGRYMPGVPLFLYGHNHRFEDRVFRYARFINVAALDKPVTFTRPRSRDFMDNIRNVNFGTYAIINVGVGRLGTGATYSIVRNVAGGTRSQLLAAEVKCESLYSNSDLADWERLDGGLWPLAPWIYDDPKAIV